MALNNNNSQDDDVSSSANDHSRPPDSQAAADVIRHKLARLYDEEPAAPAELSEAEGSAKRSKHQEFMYKLGNSGKDLATIQTEWHDYYQKLSDDEKYQVWQEFYDSQSLLTKTTVVAAPAVKASGPAQVLAEHKQQAAKPPRRSLIDNRTKQELRSSIRNKVTAGGQLKLKHHLQSLFFGLTMGIIVVFIFLFGFFNEVFITPFIQPARTVTATPIILSNTSIAPTSTPEVIIPKINVQIPVDYSETSTNEAVIENDLEDGVVHYPTTVLPGQNGNAAFFGHSSNNIFNQGKYKFAFVLLHTLVSGDTFYLTYSGKVYVYKVISKNIVSPSDVGVLGPVPGQTATATLITCDPPGTSINRLVVVGQQISPSPSGNTTPTNVPATTGGTPTELPGNGPTLWSRFIGSISGKVSSAIIAVVILWLVIRWINKPMRRMKA